MFHPESLKILVWNEVVGVFYIISYFLDPLIVIFAFEPLKFQSVRILMTMSTVLFLIDMIVTLFTAQINEQDLILDDESAKKLDLYKKEKSLIGRSYDLLVLETQQKKLRKDLDDQKLNRDFCYNLKVYLKTTLISDCLANIPFFFYLPYIMESWSILLE